MSASTPCEIAGNVLYLDGDPSDWIHPGTETIVDGMWVGTASETDVVIQFTPPDIADGFWRATFSTSKVGAPLAVGVYESAERNPFETDGHPGLDVSGDGRGCNMLTGRFEILEVQTNGTELVSLLATFEQHCEGVAAVLRGCVHYGP